MRLGRLRALHDVRDITKDTVVGLLTGAIGPASEPIQGGK
jgi:hypothetical protein